MRGVNVLFEFRTNFVYVRADVLISQSYVSVCK